MAEKKYELASAYVTIMPSFEGMKEHLQEEIKKSAPGMQTRLQNAMKKAGELGSTAFGKTFGADGFMRKFAGVVREKGSSAFTKLGSMGGTAILSGLKNAASKLGGMLFSGAKTGITKIGNFLSSTVSSATKSAMAGLGAAIGAVGAQTLGGGLNRALDLNAAQAKLSAFGYDAKEVESIVDSVKSTVSGTRFTTPEALTTTTQLLAAGIKPGEELEKILQNTVKLADMGGVEFGDFGSIVAKAYAGGTIYAEDLNQIMDKGIGISSYLAQTMGVSTDEVKKLASEGAIGFEDLMTAVEAVEFDSAILASKDARLAFGNLRAALSSIGEKLWLPITDRAAEFFLNIRNGINAFASNPAFMTMMQKINDGTASIVEKAIEFSKKFEEFMGSEKIKPFLSAILRIREGIEGIEGPVIGLGLAIASSFLGGLPIIGGFLGGLSIPAGILLGTIAVLATKFSEFQRLIEGVFTGIGKFFEGFAEGLNAEEMFGGIIGEENPIQMFFANIADIVEKFDFNKLGSRLGTDFKDFFGSLITELPRIGSALSSLFGTLGESLSMLSGGTDAGGVVENIVNIIVMVINGIDGFLPILITLVTGLSAFITSPLVTTIFTALVTVAGYIVQNEYLLTTFLAILAAIFIGGKLKGVADGITKASTWLGKGLEAFSKSMEKGMKAFFKLIKTMGTGVTSSLPQILILGAVIIGIAGLLKLLESIGFFEILKGLISFVLDEITTLIERLTPVLGEIIEMINGFLLTMMEVIVGIVPPLVEAFALVVDTIVNGITQIIDSTVLLISTLATDGEAAGAGALVLAGGLLALSGALVALSGGNALGSLGNLASGLMGGESPVEQIISLTESLSGLSTEVMRVPEVLESIVPLAQNSGIYVTTAFGTGMLMGLNPVQNQLRVKINSILNGLQSQLNSKPLKIRVEAPNISSVSGRSGAFGNISNNVSNTFNVRNLNDGSTLDSILKGGR